MRQIKHCLDKILSAVCAALMAFMSVLVVYQVFTRYVLNNPSTFSEDLLTYVFVWMSLFSTALVFGEREHMSLSIFSDRLKGKYRIFLSVATELIIMVITYIVFINGGRAFMNVGATQISPTLHIPMICVYAIMPVCGIIIIVYCILNMGLLVSRIPALKGGDES